MEFPLESHSTFVYGLVRLSCTTWSLLEIPGVEILRSGDTAATNHSVFEVSRHFISLKVLLGELVSRHMENTRALVLGPHSGI